MAKFFDVVVAGGGVVGMSSALELQARGLRVAVVDPGDARRRASFGHGGMISRISIFPMASPSVRANALHYGLNLDPGLQVRYGALPQNARWLMRFLSVCDEANWRATAAKLNPLIGAARRHHDRLAASLGLADFIRPVGWVKAYRTPGSYEKTARERAVYAEHGIKVTILDSDELAELEPSLTRRFHKGIWSADSGHVRDPWAWMERLHAVYLERGGEILKGEVRTAQETQANVRVETSGGLLECGHFVLAAGAWSDRILRNLGVRIVYAAERGYYRHFALPEGMSLERPVYDVEGGYSLHPTESGVRICGGVELGRLDDPPNPRQLDIVTPRARLTLPFGEQIEEDWMGPRPSTPDGVPVIGRPPGRQRVICAFGHGHSGFGTGPLTGAIVADLIGGQTPELDITPFAIDRLLVR